MDVLNRKIVQYKEAGIDHKKFYKINVYLQKGLYFGLVFSISFLVMSILYIPLNGLHIIWLLGFFFACVLVLITISGSLIDTELSLFKEKLELISWLYIKFVLCLLLSIVLSQLSVFNRIFISGGATLRWRI